MKRIIILLICFFCSYAALSQATQWRLGIDSASGNPKLYHDTIIVKPNLPNYYLNGYGAFYNLRDTVRTYISLTTTGSSGAATYSSATGVLNIPQYSGGGGTPAGNNNEIQYDSASAFTAHPTFKYFSKGGRTGAATYSGLYLSPRVTAQANSDTMVSVRIIQDFNVNGKANTIKQTFKIDSNYFNMDNAFNFSFGIGDAGKPGNSVFIGESAGQIATSAGSSNFIGYYAGGLATSASSSNFIGTASGYSATNATNSNFVGTNAGNTATNASFSNFYGSEAGFQATTAQYSNFFGSAAGRVAISADHSNFFGAGAGQNASSAYASNFFGTAAGYGASSAYNSNFYGNLTGQGATNASNSNFFGERVGWYATGGAYSTFIGYRVADSTTFKVSGTNNIIIGTNITLPTAATSNTFNIGNVLYGTNTYATTTGNPSATAQTTGQVGINVTTPVASAALQIDNTTMGLLPPRMTTTQKNAISSPAEGLIVYDLTLHKLYVYDGSTWQAAW